MRQHGLPFTAARAAASLGLRFATALALGLVSASLGAQGLASPLTLPQAYDAAVRHDAQYQIANIVAALTLAFGLAA